MSSSAIGLAELLLVFAMAIISLCGIQSYYGCLKVLCFGAGCQRNIDKKSYKLDNLNFYPEYVDLLSSSLEIYKRKDICLRYVSGWARRTAYLLKSGIPHWMEAISWSILAKELQILIPP